ncbi:MAG: hypothetical protein ACTIJJ_05490 [Galactobacter sp.]
MYYLFPIALLVISLAISALLHPVRFVSAVLAIFFGLGTLCSGVLMLVNPAPVGLGIMFAFGIPWVLVLWFRRRIYG